MTIGFYCGTAFTCLHSLDTVPSWMPAADPSTPLTSVILLLLQEVHEANLLSVTIERLINVIEILVIMVMRIGFPCYHRTPWSKQNWWKRPFWVLIFCHLYQCLTIAIQCCNAVFLSVQPVHKYIYLCAVKKQESKCDHSNFHYCLSFCCDLT